MKPNYAWAQQVPKDDPRIKTEVVTVQSPQGNGSIKGLFAKPAKMSGKLPGIIVIHENRGLNPYVEDVARRFAVANYIAYAPDGLTSVGGFPGNDEQGAVKFREVNGPKMMEDFVASANWLRTNPECTGKIGAIGFCFGGGIVNQLAVRLGKDLAAGAPFYGRQPGAEDVAEDHGADPGALRRSEDRYRRRHRHRAVRSRVEGERQEVRDLHVHRRAAWFPQRHHAAL